MVRSLRIEGFSVADRPVATPVTKFGGQPVWLTGPQWPISAAWDRPMRFVGQIELGPVLGAAGQGKLAYVFVTHADHQEEDFFDPDIIDPDGGENAVIVQPGGDYAGPVHPLVTGPGLHGRDGSAVEFTVDLRPVDEPAAMTDEELEALPTADQDSYAERIDGDKIGGTPSFFQGDSGRTAARGGCCCNWTRTGCRATSPSARRRGCSPSCPRTVPRAGCSSRTPEPTVRPVMGPGISTLGHMPEQTDQPLGRAFFDRHVVEVAPDLLGRVLVCTLPEGTVTVRLTEVEAYNGQDDPGSHAYRGRTARNEVMFGPPGHVYVYFTYGMHFCMNLVTDRDGHSSAVLLRAGEVLDGVDLARKRRTTARKGHELAQGPARLTMAIGVDRAFNGADACGDGIPFRVLAGTPPEPALIRTGPRTGVSGAGATTPWRFWIDGDPTVSPYRAHVPKRKPSGDSGNAASRARS